jgi:hypothetical protein
MSIFVQKLKNIDRKTLVIVQPTRALILYLQESTL